MVGNRASLRQDIKKAVSKLTKGSSSSRFKRRYVFNSLINDLQYIKQLPPTLSGITDEAINRLVKLWRFRDNRENTICCKLGALRKIFRVHVSSRSFPTNEELGVIKWKPKKKPITPPFINPYKIQPQSIRNICVLQYLFGLKKIEAIRCRGDVICQSLSIPRALARNKKDRYVPIVTEKQRQWVSQMKKSNESEKLLSLSHKEALKKYGVKDGDYFRYLYINWRYRQLKKNGSKHNDCLKILRSELGYVRSIALREVLECLGVS